MMRMKMKMLILHFLPFYVINHLKLSTNKLTIIKNYCQFIDFKYMYKCQIIKCINKLHVVFLQNDKNIA